MTKLNKLELFEEFTNKLNQNRNGRRGGLGLGRGNGRGNGRGGSQSEDWVNSPTLAYITVYGKEPTEEIAGLSNSPKRKYKNITVDKNLKDEWLDALNSLPVDIRSTEEGKDSTRVAHVAFRFKKGDEKMSAAKNMVKLLKENKNIYAAVDVGGDEDRIRIMVAGKIWIGKPKWADWWQNIANIIKVAYEQSH